ncbi:MAG: S8 family serine peptidase [Weeksellaceae bacterium]
MKKDILKLCFLLFFLASPFMGAQTVEQAKQITAQYDLGKLQVLQQTFLKQQTLEKENAIQVAKLRNLPLIIEKDGKYQELQKILPDGTPLYYTTFNADASKSTRTNHLNTGGSLGLNLMGLNMTAHIWDAGLGLSSHQEYDGAGGNNRYSIGDGTTFLHYHSAHVAGTIMASGVVAQAKGMAPYGKAVGYDWDYDVSEATSAASNGMLVSSHSYGYRSFYDNGTYALPTYYAGAYIQDSKDWDNLLFNAPYYLMVVAAGNDGDRNITATPLLTGYDKLTGHSTSKNNLVIANANDANIDSNGNLIGVTINYSSSQGPTDDLRIKPDLTGNGTSVYSTYETADNAYASITGTSMATPNVSGSLLLLQEHYNNLNGNFMRAATLKGLVLHTADDAGPSGPDAVWGWGLMNSKRAAEVISHNESQSLIHELSISNGQTLTFEVDSDGINPLLASISWTDRPGSINTGVINSPTPVLVNDLDLRITKNTTTYYPWKLTGVTTNGKEDNKVDPFERIDIPSAAGTYTITISHKGNLTDGNQNFSLIVSGIVTAACPLSVSSATGDPICGAGSTEIIATGSLGTTELRLYTASLGGSPIASLTGDSGVFTTPSITETTTFYVAAADSNCESARFPVTITVNSAPEPITINQTNYPINGDSCDFDYAELIVDGAMERNFPIYMEDFADKKGWAISGTSNSLRGAYSDSNEAGGDVPEIVLYWYSGNTNGNWTVFPRNEDTTLLAVDLETYTNLKFEFKQKINVFEPNIYKPKIYLEASTNGINYSTIWSNTTISSNIPAQTITVDLSSYQNISTFYYRFKFSGDSYGLDQWYIDDIKITGDKELDVTWSPETGLFLDQNLTLPYNGESTPSVFAAPNGTQTYTASATSATFSCAATDTVEVSDNAFQFIANSGDWNLPTNWSSNTLPDITSCVKVPNNKTLTVNVEDAQAKTLTIEAGGKIIIPKDKALTVADFVKNEAGFDNFIIESGGSLVQIEEATNTGEITVEREFTFSSGRQQYNYIISPVIGQKIKEIYDNPPFVIYHKENKNFFYNAGAGNYDLLNPAKGFAIKEASSGSADTIGKMKGVPVNGSLDFTLTYTPNPTDTVFIPGYNLIGNPYPSNLDMDKFYTDNLGKIDGTFQFWDNRGNTVNSQQGSSYGGANYAKYNAVNSTGTAAGVPSGYDSRKPTNLVRPATAFMVRALENPTSGRTLNFNNTQRIAQNDSPEFFGKNNFNPSEKDRYWLTLRTPTGMEYMTAVVYFWNGSNDFTLDDSETNGSSDDIYTLVGEEQIAIHGRAPFVKTDKVPLGVRLFEMGTYVISLYDKEGVFANGQNIYIRDKKLKTTYNLTEADYKFIEDAGEFNDRFEIIYLPHSFTADNASDYAYQIQIEKKDGNFVVTSEKEKITQVEVFALNGRSVFQKSEINNLEFKVPVNRLEKQIIVFVVETETGEVITKKFINK